MYFALVNMKAESGPEHLPSLHSGCSGIHYHHIVGAVVHHAKYMGVPADENIRLMPFNHGEHIQRIVSGVASYVGHQHLEPFAAPKLGQGTFQADFLSVAVAIYSYKGLESGNLVYEFEASAEVAGVPDFIYRGEEFLEFVAEYSVRIRYYSYEHDCKVNKKG